MYSRVIRDLLNSEANKLDKQMLEYNLKQIDGLEDLDDAAKEAVFTSREGVITVL